MPNLDFYAVDQDFDEVLGFVFATSACRVFEAYSPPDTELAEFHSVEEIRARYPLGTCRGRVHSAHLMLWPIKASTAVFVGRIDLKPGSCGGATHRYRVEGWGLIQLALGGRGPEGIVVSHTNHNSAARATAWESSPYADRLGPVSAWDWAEVTRASRQLNNHVRRRLAVDKVGSRSVLPCAAEALAAGTRAL
jgi:hypothetical protein